MSTSSFDSDTELKNKAYEAVEELIRSKMKRVQLMNSFYQMLPKLCESSSIRRHRRKYIDKGHLEGHNHLYNDYFSDNLVYSEEQFRRRFRMRKSVFLRIVEALQNYSPFLKQKKDVVGKLRAPPLQKCTTAIRMLAYEVACDILDDYLQIAEGTIIQCIKKFLEGIITCFGYEYLRRPNSIDIQCLLTVAEHRRFSGMLGSIDCIHWEWKNYPVARHGMYSRGDHGCPTIILEAVASYDTWIWHAFFGVLSSNNDINVLKRSSLFDDILEGGASSANYTINGKSYITGYYLTDSIYPEWSIFVKSISYPRSPKEQLFAKHQEGCRKDIEQVFGILQSHFHIVHGPSRFWDQEVLGQIMRACIILHNIIVEDVRDNYNFNYEISDYESGDTSDPTPHITHNYIANYATYIQNNLQLRDRANHHQLQVDLIEHVWQQFGTTS